MGFNSAFKGLMVQILDTASDDGHRDKVSHIPVLGVNP